MAEILHCSCVLLRRPGQAFLVKRAADRRRYPNVWDLVGGHLEPGESAEAALRREMAEEVGIEPSRHTLLGTIVEPHPEINDPHRYHIFEVDRWRGGEPRLLGPEHSALGWFTLEAALRLDLALDEYADYLRRSFDRG